MPTPVIVHNAFISSPGDVDAERKSVPRIIAELNAVYLQATGHILWPLMWETMSGGLGEDVQAVINRQTPDYDIFVGIIWSRFGTPTKRAGSGTEEEFKRALALHSSRTVNFMVFVKTADLPHDVDESQLKDVRAFKQRLQDTGILYHRFGTPAEFEALLRQHMLQYLAGRTPVKPQATHGDQDEPTRGTPEKLPHNALLSDLVEFSSVLERSIALMATHKRDNFEEGRRLLHQATIKLVANGSDKIKALNDWTRGFGRSCYTTIRPPRPDHERASMVAELSGIAEQISDWRRLMERAPAVDRAVSAEFAVAREFFDRCACAVQTSAYGLNGAPHATSGGAS